MIEWILSSSLLIILMIILRHYLKGKILLRLQYGLWAIVLVRLLIPVSFGESVFSVINILPNQTVERLKEVSNLPLGYVGYETPDPAIAELDLGQATAELNPGQAVAELNPGQVQPSDTKAQQSNAETPAQYEEQRWKEEMEAAKAATGYAITISSVLCGIWIGGILVVGACLIWANLRFAGQLKRSRRIETIGNYNGSCPLPVYVSSAIETPCMFGLLHPVIYITPEVMEDTVGLYHVLTHEITHYRHKDHIWSALRSLCLVIHWYNPLVWIASTLSRRDAELACDEATIRSLGEDKRIEYGRTLIGLTCKEQRPGSFFLTATSMTGSKKSFQERIVLIAKKPQMAVYTLLVAVIAVAIVMVCTFTGTQKGDPAAVIEKTTNKQETAEKSDANAEQNATAEPDTTAEQNATAGSDATTTKLVCIGEYTTVWEGLRLELYRLEYGLSSDHPENAAEAGGIKLEDDWITELESTGQPYLLLVHNTMADERYLVTTATTDTIMTNYGQPEYVAQYGDCYRAASMELFYQCAGAMPQGEGAKIPLTEQEIAQVNEAFAAIIKDADGTTQLNPATCIFSTFFEKAEEMDLAAFMYYFPYGKVLTEEDEEEFLALEKSEGWRYSDKKLADMPVPVHRYSVQDVEAVLQKYLGISLEDLKDMEDNGANLSEKSLYYLEEYEAFYNTTSDAGFAMFTCVRGEIQGDKVYLYSQYSQHSETGGEVLILKKLDDRYVIESHLTHRDFLDSDAVENMLKQKNAA